MRRRQWVTVAAFAAATAVGCIIVRKLKQRGKPENQEPKRRTTKHPEGPTTGPGRTVVQTDKAVVSHGKAAQGDAKQPAGRTTASTALIAAFRPVEQLPASSAADVLPASVAGSDASGVLQESEFRSHLTALLLRAKILRLELADRPENAHDTDSAVCPVSLERKIAGNAEAAAPHDAPVNIASPLSFWPDLTGDAQVHRSQKVPKQQSQLQRQHSPETSAAASALAAATTPAAEGSMSSRDVSAESSPRAVCLLQPEQAVGDAQGIKSAGNARPQVQNPPVGRVPQPVSAIQAVLPASDANPQQQYAAASQPSSLSSASADVVVPQVQGRAVVESSAAVDGDQICLVEDDRQPLNDGQALASAEEVASRVQDATVDDSPQVLDRATLEHAALATSPAVNAEPAPTNAATAEAAAAAESPMDTDADIAIWLQHEEDCKSAGRELWLHSVESMAALGLHADIGKLRRRSKLRPISTSYHVLPMLSWQDMYQCMQLEQAIALSLGQSAVVCVGGKTPLETRAGADRDSPYGRLPFFFSHVRSIKGDGNCFYRALQAGMVEGLCLDPRPACIAALSAAFMSQRAAMESCPIINHQTKALALQGHNFLQDMLQGIGRPGKTWQDLLAILNNQAMDQAMVQFLRAITARELWDNQPKYSNDVCIDVYRGMSFAQIVQHETLRMTAYAEEVQVCALRALLPVRLKLLASAGDEPYVRTCEPGLPLSPSRPIPAADTQAQTASAAGSAAESPQQVWLRHRPGHYELVYPAEGCENVHGGMKTW